MNSNASGLSANNRKIAREVFKMWRSSGWNSGIPGAPNRVYTLGELFQLDRELKILKNQYGGRVPSYVRNIWKVPNGFSNKLKTFKTKVLPLFNSARLNPRTGNYISNNEIYHANKFNNLKKKYNF